MARPLISAGYGYLGYGALGSGLWIWYFGRGVKMIGFCVLRNIMWDWRVERRSTEMG